MSGQRKTPGVYIVSGAAETNAETDARKLAPRIKPPVGLEQHRSVVITDSPDLEAEADILAATAQEGSGRPKGGRRPLQVRDASDP